MNLSLFFVVALLVALAFYQSGVIHIVDYGYIGVYKRGGALLDYWTEPGLHFMTPFLTQYFPVQITLQTDMVTNIPCGTSSGVILNFEKIQVVNRLKKQLAQKTIKNYTVTYDQTWIFSKIHHEINQFCSRHTLQEVLIDKFNQLDQTLKNALQKGCDEWAPGIQIIAVRVTKPKVPEEIALTYEQREVQRTKLLLKQELQKLRKKQSQIQKRISKIDAKTFSIVEGIQNKKNLLAQNTSRKIQQIQNEIVKIMALAFASAKKFRQEKLIELNKKRLIPQKLIESILINLKDTHKNIYHSSLPEYLDWIEELVNKDIKRSKTKSKNDK